MFRIALFGVFVSLTLAHSYKEHYEEHSAPQPYDFGYRIHDGEGQQYRQEVSDGNGVVRGSYGFTDHRGIYREVHYIADHNGFRATVKTNEPGTANQDPAHVNVMSAASHHVPLHTSESMSPLPEPVAPAVPRRRGIPYKRHGKYVY